MTNVWIVMGTTGEYSDRSEWPICVYTNKQAAEDHVEQATQLAHEYGVGYDDTCDYDVRRKLCDEIKESNDESAIKLRRLWGSGGNYFSIDYTGLRFWCEEVPIQ